MEKCWVYINKTYLVTLTSMLQKWFGPAQVWLLFSIWVSATSMIICWGLAQQPSMTSFNVHNSLYWVFVFVFQPSISKWGDAIFIITELMYNVMFVAFDM